MDPRKKRIRRVQRLAEAAVPLKHFWEVPGPLSHQAKACNHGFKPRAPPPYRAHIPQSVGDSFGVFFFAYTATWVELA